MAEIKVRGLEEEVVDRLTTQAKAKGYTTREEFLRDVLIQLSLDEFQLESDRKYYDFLNRILDCLTQNDQTLQRSCDILERFYEREGVIE